MSLVVDDPDFQLWQGDALEMLRGLPSGSVHCALTSPPFYGLRDYSCEGQIGLEATPDEWVARLVDVFREVRRVLRDDGTFWCEVGDGYENKQLVCAPWLLAFALRADGWYLRSEIIWDRPNPMPESVTDRPTKSHSTVFLLAKSKTYFFDQEAVREQPTWADPTNGTKKNIERGGWVGGGINDGRTRISTPGGVGVPEAARNVRSVWRIATQPTPFAHFATWPEKLVERIILAGTSERGCCPECGAPWEREVERGESDYARLRRDQGHEWTDMDAAALANGTITRAGEGGQTRNANGTVPSLKAAAILTTGWIPSCKCAGDGHRSGDLSDGVRDDGQNRVLMPVPCTVLDPFMGSGTTALVARRLGRRSVGVELSPEYAELCARRLSQQSLFA